VGRAAFHPFTRVVRGRRGSRAPDGLPDACPNGNGGASLGPAAGWRPYHAPGASVAARPGRCGPRPLRRSAFHPVTCVMRGRRRSPAPDGLPNARPNGNGGASSGPAPGSCPYHAPGASVAAQWAVRRCTTHPVRRWRTRCPSDGVPRTRCVRGGPVSRPTAYHAPGASVADQWGRRTDGAAAGRASDPERGRGARIAPSRPAGPGGDPARAYPGSRAGGPTGAPGPG